MQLFIRSDRKADDEIKRFLDNCKGHTRDIAECAMHTGMRRGEILGLKWSQIKNGFIYLKKNAVNLLNDLPAPKQTENSTCHKTVTKTKPRKISLG
jgi:integrase